MTHEDDEVYRNNNFCGLCEKNLISVNFRGHCHLTSKNRGPAHIICNSNVTEKHKNFIPFVFHKLFKFVCHLFFPRLVDEKNDKVKFDFIPKTNKNYISVTYGCKRVIDSDRFLSSGLDSLVKTLVDNFYKTLK